MTIIDTQYDAGQQLVAYLNEKNEITLSSEAENNFRKNILLSAASYFEKEISDIMLEFVSLNSNNNESIIALVTQKVVKRQYHTYFDWDTAKNANSFFKMFGESFKVRMTDLVKENENLDIAIKAFLQLGQERNKLVHQNFAEIIIDKTAGEIYNLYKMATSFVGTVRTELGLNGIAEQ